MTFILPFAPTHWILISLPSDKEIYKKERNQTNAKTESSCRSQTQTKPFFFYRECYNGSSRRPFIFHSFKCRHDLISLSKLKPNLFQAMEQRSAKRHNVLGLERIKSRRHRSVSVRTMKKL